MARKNSAKAKRSSKSDGGNKSLLTVKKLRRSSSNRVLLGVMGGIAEYFNADPTHVRIAWWTFVIITTLAAGAVAYALVPTVLTIIGVAYIIAFLLMNETPAK